MRRQGIRAACAVSRSCYRDHMSYRIVTQEEAVASPNETKIVMVIKPVPPENGWVRWEPSQIAICDPGWSGRLIEMPDGRIVETADDQQTSELYRQAIMQIDPESLNQSPKPDVSELIDRLKRANDQGILDV